MQTLISKLVIKVKQQLLVLLRSKNQHMRQRPKTSMILRSVLDLRFTKAHVSLHAFQDCDTVGAYAGLGISKAFKKWQKNMTI